MEALEFSMVRFDRSGIISSYLREVRKYKTISTEQVKNYLREGKTTPVVNANLRLVLAVALRYMWAMPLLDLIQEGNIGLLNATRKFNVYGDTAFSTFAVLEIRKAIIAAVQEQSRLVRRPHHAQDEWVTNTSLDEGLDDGEGNTATKGDSLAGDMGIDEFLDDIELIIAGKMARLDEREKSVIRRYYGIGTDVPMGYSAIGMMLGISDERARQLHLAALAKMRA